ncbi:MAG: hypothetical protein HOV80_07570 [Polyangiaceae bacterium]|nr:hypothetical protein [Polyangiaceae bacterium]
MSSADPIVDHGTAAHPPSSRGTASSNGNAVGSHYDRLPAPSALDLGREALPAPPPAFVVKAVLGLRRAMQRLTDALCPADLAMFDTLTGVGKTALLGAVARYRIPDLLEAGPLSAEEIAERAKLDADAVHRALRALAPLGIFRLRSDGKFENTRLSKTLGGGRFARMREFAIHYASGSHMAAWGDFAKTLATGRAAFDRVHGMTVWDWFEKHPDEREMFAHVMMGLTLQDAPVIATVYPWREVKKVCDVGGGRGSLLSELLVRHRHLWGVLCDAKGVLSSAEPVLSARGVRDRVDLVPGNFFEEVPEGADAYVLKNILHDWDDASCRTILHAVRAACYEGARLVVSESIVERNSKHLMGTVADLHMMTICSNGRERGVAEIRSLMEETGFRMGRVFEYPTMSVLEGIAV